MVEIDLFLFFLGEFNVGNVHVLEDCVDAATGLSLDVVEKIHDRPFGADQRDNLQVGPDPAQIVQCQDVERVSHRHEEALAEASDGNHLIRLSEILGNEVDNILRHMHFGQRDRRDAETPAHADHHVLLGYELLVEQQLKETAALLLLKLDDLTELLLG